MVENTSNRDLTPQHFLGVLAEGSDNYIQGMEAAGQQQLVRAAGLMPAQGDWEALRELGFGEPEPTEDALFVKTTLPEGWSKGATDHDMHSSVLDERGVERVSVFYKAAFYDRRADFHIVNVGAHLGTEAIYGDDKPALPKQWAVLTVAEKANFTQALRAYQERAAEYPDIYGDRLPRVEAILALVEAPD